METLKVYVGTEPKQWLASEVLRYSIAKRTKAKLEYQELKHISLDLRQNMYTGFSIYRFYIPELCGYKGKAIYLDADIVVLCDLLELLNCDMQGHGALARPMHPDQKETTRYTSVMLLDCEKLKHWKLHEWVKVMNVNKDHYRATLWCEPQGLATRDFGDLPEYFNHLDHWDEKTKIIHFTNVPMQPWKKRGHPFAGVFLKELKSAIEDDEIPVDAIEREIGYGHIYPEIIQDLALT